MLRNYAYLTSSTLLALSLLVACQPSDDPGGDVGTETGDGDGDGDGDETVGDGDGDETVGDGDGDGDETVGDGDGDGDPDSDSDEDGIPDSEDNCPDDPNPNQLDFDGNGVGNVCDVQVFTTVGGTLASSLGLDTSIHGSCSLELEFEIASGEVRVQLDDDAAVAAFEIVSLELANLDGQTCTLGTQPNIAFESSAIELRGEPFPVSTAHSSEDHDAGVIAGEVDEAHPVEWSFTLVVQYDGGEPEPHPFVVETSLPVFTADIGEAGASGTLTWDDVEHSLVADEFTTDNGNFDTDVDLEIKGLDGALTLAP